MASLLVMNGPDQGREYPVDEIVVIGRDRDAVDVQVPDGRASRKHASVHRDGATWILRDLRSSNGTFLEGNAVTEAVLRNGARITVGDTQLVFRDETRVTPVPQQPPRRMTVSFVPLEGEKRKKSTTVDIPADRIAPVTADQLADLGTAQRHYLHLQTLFEASKAFAGTHGLSDVLEQAITLLLGVFPRADRTFVVLRDPDTDTLRPVASRDRLGGSIADIRLSRKVVQRVLDEKRAVLSCDATGAAADAEMYQTMAAMRIRSFICAPLIARDQVLGILQLDSSRAMGAFSEEDLSLLTGLASQAALAIQNARYDQERRLSYLSNIGSLLNAVEARDPYTRGHSMRVADFAVLTAHRLNASRPPERAIDIERLRYAAQLHDAGKISLEVKVLHKASTLDEHEFEEVKRHPLVTYFILSAMHLPSELKGLDMLAALHHERWDGLGYPCGLKGEQTPIESRILAAADLLDAMTSDRPYRKALPLTRAVAEMVRVSGTQLDPQVVDTLVQLDVDGELASVLGLYRRGDMTGSFTPIRFREMVLDQLRQS